MEIGGTYPMLYAFFDEAGRLRRDAVARQVEASLAAGASGIAVLGLGTEVHKLGRDERRALVEWTIADVAGRVPVAVTVADGNVPDMIDSARFARDAGAVWLILQPPRPPASGAHLIEFFGAVADAVDQFLRLGAGDARLDRQPLGVGRRSVVVDMFVGVASRMVHGPASLQSARSHWRRPPAS